MTRINSCNEWSALAISVMREGLFSISVAPCFPLSVFYHWLSPKGCWLDSSASNNWKVKLCALLLMLTGSLDSRCFRLRANHHRHQGLCVLVCVCALLHMLQSHKTPSWQLPMTWSFPFCNAKMRNRNSGKVWKKIRTWTVIPNCPLRQ